MVPYSGDYSSVLRPKLHAKTGDMSRFIAPGSKYSKSCAKTYTIVPPKAGLKNGPPRFMA